MDLYFSQKQKPSRPLVLFVSGLMPALAVFCYLLESAAVWTAAAAAGIGALCLILRKRFPIVRRAAVVLAGVCAAGCLFAVYGALVCRPALALAGKGGSFTGSITAYPELFDDYTRVEWKIESRNGEKLRPVRVRLYLDGDYSALQPGDALRVETQLAIPGKSWRFDTRRYLNAHGVFLQASASNAVVLDEAQPSFSARLLRFARQIHDMLHKIMPDRESGLAAALIFGDESGLDDAAQSALRLTGLSHITAASGMNVAFLVGIVLALLGRRAGSAAAIPVVLLFILMTGAPASVVRAGIMQILWLLSLYLIREPDSLTSLFTSAAVILGANPFAIADLSFLLSFFSTLGIIVYGGKLYQTLSRRNRAKNRLIKRLLNAALRILTTTLTAQLFILPIQALFFGEISLIAPLSNLLVLWASEYAFTLGAAAALAGFIWLPLGLVLAWLPRFLCGFILYAAALLGKIPFAAISAKSAYIVILLIFGYLLFALLRVFKGASAGLAAVCMAGVCAAAFVFTALQQELTATLAVVSTGTGQSAVICQGEGCVVFNCGGSRAYALSGLEALLWENGQREIDALMLSSYRQADSGNLTRMLTAYRVRALYLPEPKDAQDAQCCEQIINAAAAADTPVTIVSEDLSFSLEEIGIELYVNHSDDADDGRLLMGAQASGQRLVALGAIQAENLGRTLQRAAFSQVDILALGDYYSDRAPPGCLRSLGADYAVISAFSEVDADLVYALSRGGTQALDTQRQGSFAVRTPRIYKTPE